MLKWIKRLLRIRVEEPRKTEVVKLSTEMNVKFGDS